MQPWGARPPVYCLYPHKFKKCYERAIGTNEWPWLQQLQRACRPGAGGKHGRNWVGHQHDRQGSPLAALRVSVCQCAAVCGISAFERDIFASRGALLCGM